MNKYKELMGWKRNGRGGDKASETSVSVAKIQKKKHFVKCFCRETAPNGKKTFHFLSRSGKFVYLCQNFNH
jgi:hypothetical protein